VIEAYNSMKAAAADRIPLRSYNLGPFECVQVELEEDGRICEECLSPDDPHPLIDGKIAVQLSLIEEKYRERMTCDWRVW